jgi:hypothetical protein
MFYLARRYPSALTFFTLAMCIFISGCGPSALEFNEKIVNGNARLKQANDQFGKSINTALLNGNIKQSQTDLDNLKKLLTTVQTEMKDWKVPSAQSAKELFQGYERYLKSHEGVIAQYQKIVSIAEDPSLDPGRKGQQADAIFKAIDLADQAQANQLRSLQNAFAKDHHMTLK